MAVHRNRVIYQSEALFISPDSTGYHFTGAKADSPIEGVGNGPFGLATPPVDSSQVFGGTVDSPTRTNNGQLAGWAEGDAWPEWNAKGDNPVICKSPWKYYPAIRTCSKCELWFYC